MRNFYVPVMKHYQFCCFMVAHTQTLSCFNIIFWTFNGGLIFIVVFKLLNSYLYMSLFRIMLILMVCLVVIIIFPIENTYSYFVIRDCRYVWGNNNLLHIFFNFYGNISYPPPKIWIPWKLIHQFFQLVIKMKCLLFSLNYVIKKCSQRFLILCSALLRLQAEVLDLILGKLMFQLLEVMQEWQFCLFFHRYI